MNEFRTSRLLTVSLISALVIAGIYILSVARSFFIPIALALILSLLIISASEAFTSIRFGSWRLPRLIGYLLTFFGLLFFGVAFVALMQAELSDLIRVAPQYQDRLYQLFDRGTTALRIDPSSFEGIFGKASIGSMVRIGLQTLSDMASYVGLVAVYTSFMLVEFSFFPFKLTAALGNQQRSHAVQEMLTRSAKRVQSYLLLKTALSGLTAFSSWVILAAVGVDFAGLWTTLIFVLNFIPNIGSIVATFFPCVLSLVQFDSFTPFLQVTISLTLIQILIGSVLEPRLMGRTFNLSGLVIILSLAFWGSIWGIVGMFLCVPLMVISIILLANFKQTRPIAIMLSRDGTI